jgi:hypothetical protein
MSHKRRYESHAEEQKRLAKNYRYYVAFVLYDEDKNCYKDRSGHQKEKKFLRTVAARKVRRIRIYEDDDDKNLPRNGEIDHKYFELWYTLF